ncbi:MAG TPA: hypothetical protein VE870_14800, partial [Bacteroidales bacterium]|nr:hypothetical protein [Bacteroidales bacterium]
MKIISVAIILSILMLTACDRKAGHDNSSGIPTIDELSGKWASYDTVAMEPSLRNFRGQALANRDVTSLSWLVSAPYSGGYHTGSLRVNGEVPMTTSFRWQPYQALRRSVSKNLDILSSARMIPDKNLVMWKIDIKNTSGKSQTLNLDLDMIGFISKYGGDWQWWYPYPKMDGKTTTRDEEVENVRRHIGQPAGEDKETVTELVNGKPVVKKEKASWPSDQEILQSKKYHAERNGNKLFIFDIETNAITVFSLLNKPDSLEVYNSGGSASWKISLAPGKAYTLKYLMSWSDNKQQAGSYADEWSTDFDKTFNSALKTWQDRWQAIFKPGNDIISGCFPVLETHDDAARKVYYTGPLTMLYLMNTNLPEHKKVFLTGGPKWGASITFFWDITEWSTLWSVVDPVMMKEHLSDWINIDPSQNYGKDNFGGKGVGNGYSANYWALFQMIRNYITATKDYAFLDDTINGETVMQHLTDYATNWKKISLYGQPGCTGDEYKLADFGDDEWNLLECVPTYKHIVPSFNAGYIWMMRQTADFLNLKGEDAKADSMRTTAGKMFGRLMNLYAGDGVWNSLYPDNKKVEVRHCLDFMFLGRYLPNDIPPEVKKEMIDFLYRELMTDHWMRAQSLQDIAAANSDRPDHGPLGAFDGWPAGTMDALVQMGYPQKALDFYHAIEPVTNEGTWAQAHE